MIPRLLNMDIGKIVTSSEIVQFGMIGGLEEKSNVCSLDLMTSR